MSRVAPVVRKRIMTGISCSTPSVEHEIHPSLADGDAHEHLGKAGGQ